MTAVWRSGRCGACGRPAEQFPSGRWTHSGNPCKARSQSLWRPTDLVDLRAMLVFVPDGEPLPQPPRGGRWVPCGEDLAPGIPSELGWVPPEHDAAVWDRVRAELAADAEGGDGS